MSVDALISIAAFFVAFALAWYYIRHGGESDWWPFIPYKTSYITGWNYIQQRLREWNEED